MVRAVSFNRTHYQFSVHKGAGSSNGSSYTLDIDAGAFSDNAGNTNAAKHTTNLKPAGVAGEAINLALGDLALSDHNQIQSRSVESQLAGA